MQSGTRRSGVQFVEDRRSAMERMVCHNIHYDWTADGAADGDDGSGAVTREGAHGKGERDWGSSSQWQADEQGGSTKQEEGGGRDVRWGRREAGATWGEGGAQPQCKWEGGRRRKRREESICHVPDVREDHMCDGNKDCGVDAASCRQRVCGLARFCV